ncbi:MAG: ADP-glyceromanno-heptose 6-epimerase [Candidatus Margulisbacteria bacterium]|nr:ADP-glyceromanno-heptose 6-epimerase [Candidatus Margulisiibacteriota bacterium]
MIILTGGAGFIGSSFLSKLNLEGITDILVVDELGDKIKDKNLNNKSYLDYVDKDDFVESINRGNPPKDVRAVFHIGACSSTTVFDVAYLTKNNFEYSKILAKWSLDKNIPFYYASSAATYGDGSQGFSDADEMIPKLKPLNPYGNSKQAFDLWVLENKLQNRIVGYKYFNVFGPNEYHKGDMRSVVVKAYEQINKEGKVRLFKSCRKEYKDGEQKRDFIYVKDAIEVMWECYRNPKIKGIFNLGTGLARTWNDLVNAIFSAVGKKPVIEYIDMPEEIRDKYQYFTEAKMDKIRLAGLDHKFMSLEDAVKDYAGYLKEGSYL